MGNLNKTFLKVTGNTWDVEKLVNEGKIDAKKLSWMIPDGAMLNNSYNQKYQETQEFMTAALAVGLELTAKVTPKIERTADNVAKPKGKGWRKVVTVEAQEASEAVAEYWTLDGQNYDEDPTYVESNAYDYVYDEASWNASEANGALAKYHEKYPEEDWWNNTENRACNYNDRIYIGTLVDAEASANVSATVAWASDNAQKITIDDIDYYGAIFYGFEPQDVVLFNDVTLTENANKTLQISSISYSNDCGRSWAGATNNPGAQYPWVCPIFTEDVNAKVIFRYEGANDVKPWGDKVFNAGDWGCESVAKTFGNDFNIDNFKMILEKQGVEHHEAVPAHEAVEEVYHWERDIIEG